jgi:hypothetical protein
MYLKSINFSIAISYMITLLIESFFFRLHYYYFKVNNKIMFDWLSQCFGGMGITTLY